MYTLGVDFSHDVTQKGTMDLLLSALSALPSSQVSLVPCLTSFTIGRSQLIQTSHSPATVLEAVGTCPAAPPNKTGVFFSQNLSVSISTPNYLSGQLPKARVRVLLTGNKGPSPARRVKPVSLISSTRVVENVKNKQTKKKRNIQILVGENR